MDVRNKKEINNEKWKKGFVLRFKENKYKKEIGFIPDKQSMRKKIYGLQKSWQDKKKTI